MVKKVVIIGGGDAAFQLVEFGFTRIEGADKDIKITIIKKEKRGWVSVCGLPFVLQGLYRGIDDVEVKEVQSYIDRGIDVRTETTVESIDIENKSIKIVNGEELRYDYLVIATGGIPTIPPIKGAELGGVYALRNEDDAEKIMDAMSKAKNGVVIGAGIIGLQVAVAFQRAGIKTMVTKTRPVLLRSLLDPDMASIVQQRLEKMGVKFALGRKINAIKGSGVVKSVTIDGEEIPADIVEISTGVKPDVDLARKAGIVTGEKGGIVTDRFMHVNKGGRYINNIYALGDCVEVIDAMTYRPSLSQLASTILVQGKVISDNISGISSSSEPCLSPIITLIEDLQIGSVGVTSERASKYGIKIIVGKASKFTRARFTPGKKPITVKLIFDAYSERLIGGQIISEETVAERINELSLSIRKNELIKELCKRERCYDPSLTMVEDVIVTAAEDALSARH
ncbi:MAG: pyridine nucleotide-disulfide oxidoreductase [Methanosarcinales archaeon]|nr:MAG: pyridine nucleotide-disulfide oxidoreductase [Methanosarcinales archaeon]